MGTKLRQTSRLSISLVNFPLRRHSLVVWLGDANYCGEQTRRDLDFNDRMRLNTCITEMCINVDVSLRVFIKVFGVNFEFLFIGVCNQLDELSFGNVMDNEIFYCISIARGLNVTSTHCLWKLLHTNDIWSKTSLLYTVLKNIMLKLGATRSYYNQLKEFTIIRL